MLDRNIAQDTYQLTINVENILFEGFWEIPEGVSINSYIIKGEKTAIIDGVIGWDGAPETLIALLREIDVEPESVEYLIVNHMEPDHSGWIDAFKRIKPDVKIYCSTMAKNLLYSFYGQTENITAVSEGDTLDLGNGHILSFTEIPNVHWPDTIATFDTLTGTLFSCDAFGSFGKTTTTNYADMLSQEEYALYEKETIRYFSNVLGTFSPQVKNAVNKCRALPVKMVAPGHGLIYRNPEIIMQAYSDYADYQKGPARKEITLIWGSMYGMTQIAVQHAISVLESEGITVHVHQVPQTSWGSILASAWTSTGIILAMPTYEYKMFPPMAAILEELGKKRVFNRKAFRFGSFGWSGGAQRDLDEIMTRLGMNWEFLEPVEFAGTPRDTDLQVIGERVRALVQQIKELNLPG